MTSRSSFLLCALVALGFGAVIAMRWFDTTAPIAVTTISPAIATQPMRNTNVSPIVAAAVVASAKPAEAATGTATARVVGKANGAIHFEKKPQQRDTRGESIDIDVKSAVGVWQPDGLVMRVLLLESPPAADHVDAMLGALQSGATDGVAPRSAMLELRFQPTAQAFDRNELDSATLIVSDGNSTRSADALGGLDWPGSLPSPSVDAPSGQLPSFTLEASNETVSSARETWRQSWRLSVNVPVVMR